MVVVVVMVIMVMADIWNYKKEKKIIFGILEKIWSSWSSWSLRMFEILKRKNYFWNFIKTWSSWSSWSSWSWRIFKILKKEKSIFGILEKMWSWWSWRIFEILKKEKNNFWNFIKIMVVVVVVVVADVWNPKKREKYFLGILEKTWSWWSSWMFKILKRKKLFLEFKVIKK